MKVFREWIFQFTKSGNIFPIYFNSRNKTGLTVTILRSLGTDSLTSTSRCKSENCFQKHVHNVRRSSNEIDKLELHYFVFMDLILIYSKLTLMFNIVSCTNIPNKRTKSSSLIHIYQNHSLLIKLDYLFVLSFKLQGCMWTKKCKFHNS